MVAVLVPIAVATVRGLRRGWEPVGDNAYFLIRARDVFTSHYPLLGTWTSASQNTDTDFNNPGPLLFDLWAIPAKLGGGTGLAIGVAVFNSLCVIGIAVMVRRRSGPLVAIAATAATGLLCSTIGSELLYDPWQPHSLLLPFMFLLTCVWSASAGDLAAIPWVFGLASLVVQTHLSYAVIVVALVAWALLGAGLSRRGELRSASSSRDHRNMRKLVPIIGITTLVVALCWAQPVYEQFTSRGAGNLSRLATNSTGSVPGIGVRTGTRIVADTAVVPPFWLRPSFKDDLAPVARTGMGQLDSVTPSFPVAVALLSALGGVMGYAAWEARRRDDMTASAGLITALVAFAAGLLTAWKLPNGVFGVAAHQFRWMWPASAFVTLALVAYVIGRHVDRPARVRASALAILALTVVVAVATLPTYSVGAGPNVDASASATMDRAAEQMGALAGKGPILIDMRGIAFAEPYSGPVMAELQRRRIPFVAESPGLVRQLGDSRRQTGPARAIHFRQGDVASQQGAVPGSRRVVYVEGLTPTEQRERNRLHVEVFDHFLAEGVPVDPEALRAAGISRSTMPKAGDRDAMARFVGLGTVGVVLEAGALKVDGAWRARVGRMDALDQLWSSRTLGLFLDDRPTGTAR